MLFRSYVKAYKLVNGKKQVIEKSRLWHVYTATDSSKYGNPEGVKLLSKATLRLNVGKTSSVKAKLTMPKGKVNKSHNVKLIDYVSADPTIATVNKNGKITGRKKGSCYIYVIALNGLYQRVKVTVK